MKKITKWNTQYEPFEKKGILVEQSANEHHHHWQLNWHLQSAVMGNSNRQQHPTKAIIHTYLERLSQAVEPGHEIIRIPSALCMFSFSATECARKTSSKWKAIHGRMPQPRRQCDGRAIWCAPVPRNVCRQRKYNEPNDVSKTRSKTSAVDTVRKFTRLTQEPKRWTRWTLVNEVYCFTNTHPTTPRCAG